MLQSPIMTNKNIIFIGFMGSGKSSISSELSKLSKREVVSTDKLFELDSNLFGVDEMPEPDININAQEVATKIVSKYFNNQVNSIGLEGKYDLPHSRQPASSCAG